MFRISMAQCISSTVFLQNTAPPFAAEEVFMNRSHSLRYLIIGALLAWFSVAAHAAQPQPGSAAPAFKLQDQDGKWHELKDYRGKWVALYFYPKDQTPGCTDQACEFSQNVFAYRDAGAVILGGR